MAVKSIRDLDIAGKRVLMRVDYNVPMEDGRITDDARIRASLPSLEVLFAQTCGITLMSHLGRPKGQVKMEFSLKPVAERLAELTGRTVQLVDWDHEPPEMGEIFLLENLRFSPGETSNDPEFAKTLARFGDVFINDAFGTAHRAHASMDAVARCFTEKGAGLLMIKELEFLKENLKNPKRPFITILGGSKVSDKLKLIRHMIPKVDQLLIGGAMSYTFLKAKGIAVGKSRVEEDQLDTAREIMAECESAGVALLLPLDHVVSDAFEPDGEASITLNQDIEPDKMGMDIGPETIQLFTATIAEAKTVVWNGPMGVFEWDIYSTGTITVAEALAASDAMTIVGGGDSASAARLAGVADQIDHISTGGGASLELLGGIELPGIKALEVD